MQSALAEPKRPSVHNDTKRVRLYYLDWARVFAFSLLIVYHTGLIYVGWPWHIKSEDRSQSLEHLLNFITQWRIPLLFFVSGAGTALAYKGKYLAYLKGRFQRILLPLCTGILFILPLQYLLERYWQGVPLEIILQNPLGYYIGNAPKGNFSLYHLWYLWDIWLMVVVLVPTLFYISPKLERLMANKAARYSIVVLIFAALVILKGAPDFDIIYFSLLFSLGYLVFSNIQHFDFEKPGLGLAIAGLTYAVLAIYFWRFEYTAMPYHISQSSVLKWAFRFLTQLNLVATVYGIIAAFKAFLNYQNRTVTLLNKVMVPVYIVHQLMIMLLGLAFIKAGVAPWPAFILIQVAFWPIVLLICIGIFKRFQVTRLLFGIR